MHVSEYVFKPGLHNASMCVCACACASQVDELKSEEAVRVGEREDTLPPDYRFKEEDRKQ
uniref:Uncharacterized protein n=1 Tax=Anguilla anguilla TaxID=7936 RepID=A0A0E9VAD1_ANGAN